MQVTGLDAGIAYRKPMEDHVLPDAGKVVAAVRRVVEYSGARV